jgi:hypothetical protein
MKRLLGVVVAAILVALTSVGAAGASTTVAWSATFPEQFGGLNHSPFTCATTPGQSCGSGQVVGLGQAQDVILFGAACGGACDQRTLTFADGSTIVMNETELSVSFPGNSQNGHPTKSYGNPATIVISDTIVGGTGRFAGASGSADGQVKVAGGVAIITLSGNVTF